MRHQMKRGCPLTLAALCAAIGSLPFAETVLAQCAPAEKQKLVVTDGGPRDAFGWAVGIDGTRALVSTSPYFESRIGSVHAFEHDGTAWVETQKLVASDGFWEDAFGCAVAIDGRHAIVGALWEAHWQDGEGAAYVFEHDGTKWVEQAKLKAADAGWWEHFGSSVAIDGDRALIGALSATDPNDDYTGAAYVFERSGNAWVQKAKLLASDGRAGDHFGGQVALDGNRALIGAAWHDAKGRLSGAAYIFEYDGSKWVEKAMLTAPESGVYGFGYSVSLHGDRCVVTTTMAAYVFEMVGGKWESTAKLVDPDGKPNGFGTCASLGTDRLLVGAPFDDDRRPGAGAAYVFEYDGHTWRERAKLLAADGSAHDEFGRVVALGERWLITGVPEDDRPKLFGSGSAYLFDLDAHAATWSNYGQGWPGTLGVPTLTAESNPVLGTTLRLNLVSSYGATTHGILLMGRSRFTYPTPWDGTLLVTSYGQAPLLSLLRLDPGITVVTIALPNDPLLQSKSLMLQVLEADPGASKGVSFTPGLELVLGDCG